MDKYTVYKNEKSNENHLFNIVKLSSDYDNSTFLGRWLFLWQWRFFFKNYCNENIKLKNIPRGRKTDRTDYIHNEFLPYWNSEILRAKKKKKEPNLIYPIFRQYGLSIIIFGFCFFITFFASLHQALYLDDLIQNFDKLNEGKREAKQEIVKVALIITGLTFVIANASIAFQYHLLLISLRLRVCLSELIYRKSLRLSKDAFHETSVGQILNLLTSDLNKIEFFFFNLPSPFVAIALTIYVVFKLWKYLLHYTLYGISFLLFFLPFNFIAGRIFSKMRLKASEYTDERIRLVDEFINAIKIIKIYCWEHPFAKKIKKARKKEVAKIRNSFYVFSISISFFSSISKIIVYIILATFYVSGGIVTDKIAFLCLSVFSQLTILYSKYFPNTILRTSNFLITMKRINKFLSLEEKNEILDDKNDQVKKDQKYNLSIKNMTACFSVIEKDSPNYLNNKSSNQTAITKNAKLIDVLKNINFNCKQGELVIVVGPVGSGKSSLFQAILSELKIRKGSIQVNGKLSYAPQDSWIFGGTIRENILFDSEFDQERYDKVIEVCALERDLKLFADRDESFIGERGIVLSGGQKARVSLARALYYDADIYLLDDPLSAVDSNVAKHLFRNAIKKFLKNKIVILITHQLNYIKYADKILFIKEGEQLAFGQSENCLKKLRNESESDFTKFISNSISIQDLQKQSIGEDLFSEERSLSLESLEPIFYANEQLNEIKIMEKERRLKEEDDHVSSISKIYLSYFRYGNILLFSFVIFLGFGGSQFFSTSSDYFLKLWSDYIKIPANFNSTSNLNSTFKSDDNEFLKNLISQNVVYIYSGLILCLCLYSYLRSSLFAMVICRASASIHENLFNKIVRAQMKFFYDNSVGILLNRFSRDIGILDNEMYYYFHVLIEVTLNDVVIFFVMTFSNVFLLFPICIFLICLFYYRKFYINTAKKLEILEGVGKSPVLQHLSSTLNGLNTIRAFAKENDFIEKFNRYQNDHTSINFMTITSKRWFANVLAWLQIVFVGGSLLVLTIYAENFSGSLAGFIVTYLLSFSGEFYLLALFLINVEMNLCSVDRIDRIGINLDPNDQHSLTEPPLESSKDKKPPPDWPQKGVIEFRNVTMRYYQNEDPVLKNLNFKIEEADKIGIVGRTGAGKSSILAALFRLTNYEGGILIDGINCKEIGLHDLRCNISIIPQEPVLFNGTLRSNLDPLEEYKDHKLWNSIKAVQLEKLVKELEGGLDSRVIDNGGNFSIGQKQLICLARAILKENRILVLDEATANTDPKTDELIQTTIRSVFKHCTILTIAHRLNTIMDSSKILVIDAGEIKEFDTPIRLLQDETSLFASMVDAYGEEQSKSLRRIVEVLNHNHSL